MRKLALVLVLALIATMLMGGSALAQGNSDFAPGRNADLLIDAYYGQGGVEPTGSPATDSGYVETLGGAISGGFFGNSSNSGADSDAPDNGHGVTAPLGAGPSVGGCAGVVPGASLGYMITGNGPSAVGKTDPTPCD